MSPIISPIFATCDTFPYPKYNDLVMQLGFREKYFKK